MLSCERVVPWNPWNPPGSATETARGVQKFALRMCSKDYDMNYDDLLLSFQLP